MSMMLGIGYSPMRRIENLMAEMRFLCHADELLDVEPLSFEKSCVVRYWVIRIVGRRNTADNSELLDFLPSVLNVGEW